MRPTSGTICALGAAALLVLSSAGLADRSGAKRPSPRSGRGTVRYSARGRNAAGGAKLREAAFSSRPDNYGSVRHSSQAHPSSVVNYTRQDRGAAAGERTAAEPKPDTPDPFKVLRRMSDYLGHFNELYYVGTETFWEMREFPDMVHKIELSGRRWLYVRRPDKLAGEATSGRDNRRVVYDGRTVTVIDRNENQYSVAPVPDTIEAMLDSLAADYGMALPFAGLLYRNSYEALTRRVRTGHYLGLHKIGYYSCHHLLFTQDQIDWEIWITAGDKPTPRKLRLTYKRHPGMPYTVIIGKWDTSRQLPANAFEKRVPPGALKVAMAPLDAAARETPEKSPRGRN